MPDTVSHDAAIKPPAAPHAQTPAQAIEWHAGDMPYSPQFGDHFYCNSDGRLECDHVFIKGNRLSERWRQTGGTLVIGELGFGTGLNLCETLRQWKAAQPTPARPDTGRLHFLSFERFPLSRAEIERALSRWPEIEAERITLCAGWPDAPAGRVDIDLAEDFHLTVICGAALDMIEKENGRFDAWYLDGFAPSRNPEMWSADLMRLVFEKTVPGGSFSTYAAAGFVRRNLQAAGFLVERVPGYAGKREMLRGMKPGADDVGVKDGSTCCRQT